ncbi:hypothetical protein JOC85_003170 [Bacillus mesophilus]|uniref:DUF4004 family protein n=1 Tax=Bacillus mesophilus TaxID=1808955 RepID=A0A6M0QD46_9BACI|nr:DUF4004 family protein [Bacillus mesophilus]MBM7662363.1 hypothetical protein [Bacillus mesophilus]NEY73008.1 DUF4004 family protein [Bacillus mesophilus]
MEEELLSKKELLEYTGISYGQLYRWKRMDLIPESWFIKKSSFTGQETYFPKEKIVGRVQKILELKDAYSLEELAAFFSPNPANVNVSLEELKGFLRETTLQYTQSKNSQLTNLSFNDVFYLFICEKLAEQKSSSFQKLYEEELVFLKDLDFSKQNTAYDLLAISKKQEVVWMLTPVDSQMIFQQQVTIIFKISLIEYLNELKIRLSN